jgi:hypothetical protein
VNHCPLAPCASAGGHRSCPAGGNREQPEGGPVSLGNATNEGTDRVRHAADVHSYLADARNWPQWSIVNVLAIQAGADPSWWQTTTPRGTGQPRIRADAQTGLLDHDFRDPQASWTVPAGVVPNGRAPSFSLLSSSPPSSTLTNSNLRRPLSTLN